MIIKTKKLIFWKRKKTPGANQVDKTCSLRAKTQKKIKVELKQWEFTLNLRSFVIVYLKE